jgi:hypothetical protein
MSKTVLPTRTASAIVVLVAAAVLWYVLSKHVVAGGENQHSAALELGKQYLGFATSLAGFLGIAVGGASLLTVAFAGSGSQGSGQGSASTAGGPTTGTSTAQALTAMTTTVTALAVTLAGGAMASRDLWINTAGLVVGGLLGAVYILKLKP